jgi:hypothetical protein
MVLEKKGWIDRSPLDKDNKHYDFLGDSFSYTNYQDYFFICSGKERFDSVQSYPDPASGNILPCSILAFDGVNWTGIQTGFTGFGLSQAEISAELQQFLTFKDTPQNTWTPAQVLTSNKVQAGYIVDRDVNNRPFNPSIIEFLGGRLVATGSESNPLQIKVSQNKMPFNFVVQVLSAQFTPLTTADNDRPWTLKVPTGGSPITGLVDDGKRMRVSTKDEWYSWELVEYKTSTGQLFSFDRVMQDNINFSSIVHKNAYTKLGNGIAYVSTSNTYPEFAGLEVRTSGTDNYLQYYKFTNQADLYMDTLDLSDSYLGKFGDNPIATAIDREGNPLVLCGSTFNLGKSVDRGFSNWKHIQPSRIVSIQENTYFGDKKLGARIQRVSKDYCKPKNATIETFDVGINPKFSNGDMTHEPSKFKLDGYFSKEAVIKLTFKYYSIKRKYGETVLQYKISDYVDLTEFDPDGDVKFGAIRVSEYINFPKDSFKYANLRMKIEIENCTYCEIQNIQIVYKIANGDRKDNLTLATPENNISTKKCPITVEDVVI